MADEKVEEQDTKEKEAAEEKQVAEGFAAGFEESEHDEAKPKEASEKGAAETEAGTEGEGHASQAEEQKPEYVQLTKDDYDAFKALVGKTATLEGALSKISGHTGNLQKTVQKLQAATPMGAAVEISKEDFAELEAEFPELAGHTRTALERVLKKMGVRGTAEKPAAEAEAKPADDPAQAQIAFLTELHPEWKTIVGYDLEGDAKKANSFRKWLALQPQEYQDTINATQSAAITARAIDKFLADQEAAKKAAAAPSKPKQAPKVAARQERIQAAVQPKGAGGKAPGPPQRTVHDEFRAGFVEG